MTNWAVRQLPCKKQSWVFFCLFFYFFSISCNKYLSVQRIICILDLVHPLFYRRKNWRSDDLRSQIVSGWWELDPSASWLTCSSFCSAALGSLLMSSFFHLPTLSLFLQPPFVHSTHDYYGVLRAGAWESVEDLCSLLLWCEQLRRKDQQICIALHKHLYWTLFMSGCPNVMVTW